ncbi:MAG: IscS subfamily cysteine desulfurase [Acidobacteria bacterium]|nr:IscS subfamily cysteine desulfurase [Acidobacteriota bacterium]
MQLPIYMDHHSTTPVDPRVFEAMAPYFVEKFGNASSYNHSFGWEAEEAVEKARKQVASLIGAQAEEIVFTSGATESDNLAIRGVAEAYRERGRHIITTTVEHKAVLESCKRLERQGFQITYLPVDRYGMVDVEDIGLAIKPETILISVLFANNEIGTINSLGIIGRLGREKDVLIHTDAAQAAGKLPMDVKALNVDLVSLSAHKMYGPKGVGALYIRGGDPPLELVPLLEGGGQERGLRSGTLNVAGIVGFGRACQICTEEMPAESERLRRLRDKLQSGILGELEQVYLNGHETKRLPHNLNLSFAHVDGEALLVGLSDVAVSSGAACSSASREPSYVLRALGLDLDLVQSAIRFGLGRFNTEEEVDYVKERVVETVQRLRELSPLYDASRAATQTKSGSE